MIARKNQPGIQCPWGAGGSQRFFPSSLCLKCVGSSRVGRRDKWESLDPSSSHCNALQTEVLTWGGLAAPTDVCTSTAPTAISTQTFSKNHPTSQHHHSSSRKNSPSHTQTLFLLYWLILQLVKDWERLGEICLLSLGVP